MGASRLAPNLLGTIQERNWGEQDHGRLQGLLAACLLEMERRLGIRVIIEQRLRITPTRYRVADVCVISGPKPQEQILTKPPFLCIEILSPEDRATRFQERIDDYLDFGVRYVWVIDPRSGRAWIHTTEGAREAKGGRLATADPDIVVSLPELLADL